VARGGERARWSQEAQGHGLVICGRLPRQSFPRPQFVGYNKGTFTGIKNKNSSLVSFQPRSVLLHTPFGEDFTQVDVTLTYPNLLERSPDSPQIYLIFI